MELAEAITTAIGAHGMWKARLMGAIQTGKSEFQVAVVKQDNQCAFGKWLYNDVPSTDRNSANYNTVKELHTKFHSAAAHVLELALTGKKTQAESLMGMTSEYATLSSQLTLAMMKWKQDTSTASTK